MDLDPRTEDQLRLLCDGRNREICEILDERDEPLEVDELADALVTRDVAVVHASTYHEEMQRARFELHHERLPKLAEVDLLEYDHETNEVRPQSDEAAWLDEPSFEALVAYLEEFRGTETCGIGIVEGMDAVFEYGRKMAREAEDELFTLYVSTALLEEECLEHGTRAIDRGVSISIGSNAEPVRELARETLPEATVWEPQLDWLNRQSYPCVGRLVLADRRSVMLSVLDEPPSTGDPSAETALVGDGGDNPLVVLVRELLGPRLDHLDYQSADFHSEIHT